jgi:hypothetical protein
MQPLIMQAMSGAVHICQGIALSVFEEKYLHLPIPD